MSVFVISRTGWGAREPRDPLTANPIGSGSVCFLHHSEFPTLPKSASRQTEQQRLRDIEAVHMDERGWDAIAYSYIVFPSGRVYTGRGFSHVPAAQAGMNTGHGAVCFDGQFDRDRTTWSARRAAIRLIRDRWHGNRVGYHGQVNDTDCPGKNLIAAWPRITFLAGKQKYAG